MAPIRGLPGVEVIQQRDERGTRSSLNLDPPVDFMPDLRKPEPRSAQVRPKPPT